MSYILLLSGEKHFYVYFKSVKEVKEQKTQKENKDVK